MIVVSLRCPLFCIFLLFYSTPIVSLQYSLLCIFLLVLSVALVFFCGIPYLSFISVITFSSLIFPLFHSFVPSLIFYDFLILFWSPFLHEHVNFSKNSKQTAVINIPRQGLYVVMSARLISRRSHMACLTTLLLLLQVSFVESERFL